MGFGIEINQESCHQKCVFGWEPSLMNRDEARFSEHEYMSEMVKRSGYWGLDVISKL